MLNQLNHRLRQDALPILLYLVTLVIMTYPLVFVMHDHIPMKNADTSQAIWMNWWAITAFENGYNINLTPFMFAPNGLDITLFPPRWTRLPIWIPLYQAFGEPLAYNLTILLGTLLKAYGMYLFCLWLFKNRIAAWTSGAFFAFGSAMLQIALPQPLTGSMEWIPFFMLVYAYTIEQTKGKTSTRKIILLMLLAAILFVFSVYINLKIGIFAMLLGGGYVALVFFWDRLWQYRSFWIGIVTFGVFALGLGLPILYPVLANTNLEGAVEGELEGMGIDIVNYIKPMEERPINYVQSIASLSNEYVKFNEFTILDTPYIGIVAFVFALMGVWYAVRVDNRVYIWVILAFVFLILSFGLEWMWNGRVINTQLSPIRFLQDNIVVVVLRWMYRFALVFWFPLSVLIGYGLLYRLRNLKLDWKQSSLLTLSVVMLLYGTSIFPIQTRPLPIPDYVHVLNESPEGYIVNLPLGRQESKYYMVVQIQHRRPMNEGSIARLPSGSYDFQKSIPLLSIMRGREPLWDDQEIANEEWQASMQMLLDNGFRYLVLHKKVQTKNWKTTQQWLLDLFRNGDPIHNDDVARLYDIEDLLTVTPHLPDEE